MSSIRKDHYAKRLAKAYQDLDAVEADLKTSQTTEQENALKARAEQILNEIEDLEQKIEEIELQGDKPIIKMGSLDQTLRKVDFQEAKSIASQLWSYFDKEETIAALLFFERMVNQMGDYCLGEILSILFECEIRTDTLSSQESNACRPPYLVDLSDVVHEANREALLQKLGNYHGESLLSQDSDMNRLFREKFCQSLRSGDRVLILVKNWEDVVNAPEFLIWFVEVFWKQLVDDIKQQVLPKYGRIRIVAVLAAGGAVPDGCMTISAFNSNDCFDVYNPIKVPLTNWTSNDIRKWLMDVQHLDQQEARQKASGIHKKSVRIQVGGY